MCEHNFLSENQLLTFDANVNADVICEQDLRVCWIYPAGKV